MGSYRITGDAGEGQGGTDAPAPHQPGPRGAALPRKAGEKAENRFCFSTVCRVFIDQAAAGVSIRVTQTELDRELLHAQPGAFLGWVNLPGARHRAGPGVGRGAGLSERRRVQPFGQRLCPGPARGSM